MGKYNEKKLSLRDTKQSRIMHIRSASRRFSNGIACRYGFVLCLDTKNQKSSQTEGFFAALGLTLQNGQNLGRKLLPRASPRIARASVKISYALQPHSPPLFCPFSAEAVGLTRKTGYITFAIARNEAIANSAYSLCLRAIASLQQ
jgi:hypothetical protein